MIKNRIHPDARTTRINENDGIRDDRARNAESKHIKHPVIRGIADVVSQD